MVGKVDHVVGKSYYRPHTDSSTCSQLPITLKELTTVCPTVTYTQSVYKTVCNGSEVTTLVPASTPKTTRSPATPRTLTQESTSHSSDSVLKDSESDVEKSTVMYTKVTTMPTTKPVPALAFQSGSVQCTVLCTQVVVHSVISSTVPSSATTAVSDNETSGNESGPSARKSAALSPSKEKSKCETFYLFGFCFSIYLLLMSLFLIISSKTRHILA